MLKYSTWMTHHSRWQKCRRYYFLWCNYARNMNHPYRQCLTFWSKKKKSEDISRHLVYNWSCWWKRYALNRFLFLIDRRWREYFFVVTMTFQNKYRSRVGACIFKYMCILLMCITVFRKASWWSILMYKSQVRRLIFTLYESTFSRL